MIELSSVFSINQCLQQRTAEFVWIGNMFVIKKEVLSLVSDTDDIYLNFIFGF